MRIQNVPRGLPDNNIPTVAEQIEVGAGMRDSRTQHSNSISMSEAEWFRELANADPDPRNARSDYHDTPRRIMVDNRVRRQTDEVELCEGYIESAIMYPEGAHIKIVNDENEFFVFTPETNFVVKGTHVKVIDTIVILTHDFETFLGSGEFAQDETHSLSIVEILDNEEEVVNETTEEE